MRTFAITLLLAILLGPAGAFALDADRTLTQFVHRIWQGQQGLPQPTINSICQTTDGYLWLGTQTGLVHFDGVKFTPMRQISGISLENLWVNKLLADGNAGLWMATDGAGLLYLRNGTLTQYTQQNGLPSDNVRCLMIDHRGILWIGTDKGLATFDQGKFARFGADQGFTLPGARAICEMGDHSIWVGDDSPQILAWDGARFGPRAIKSIPPFASIRDIISLRDGSDWIATTSGLIRLKDGEEHRFTTHDGLPDDWVFCLSQGTDGSLFAGTKNGFCRIRSDGIESFGTRDGLSQSTVYTLCHDREGSLWVGTKYGLNQFMDRRTIPFTTSEGLSSNNTGPVFQDDSGRIWVGTLGAGLCQFDGHRFSVITAKEGLSSDTILSLAGDGKSGLWVGTDQGLDYLSEERKVGATFSTSSGLRSSSITCLLRDRDGTLWIGTFAGLAHLRDGKLAEPSPPIHLPILTMIQRHDGTIVIAAEGGDLFACTGNRVTTIQQHGQPARDIDALYEDSDGALWMGTRGAGLRMLNGQKIALLSVKNGLYDDDIFGIASDQQDNLWMACSKGTFSVPRESLRKFAAGELSTVVCTPFSPMDALRTIECKPGVQPAAFEMRDGNVWFSTIHGVLAIDPRRQRKLLPMPVVVEDVVVNGTSQPLGQALTLPGGQPNVSFEYTALSFIVPNRLVFRYKLEGFDRDWVDAGTRREAFYTNLPAGHYRFRVMAQHVDQSWSEAALPVVFSIPPRFYQRWFFLPLCLIALAGAVFYSYRERVGRMRRRLHAVVAERSRIARELHDTLMQGFSGITMEMQALSTRLSPSQERTNLEEIIRDAGKCLKEARQSIAGLRSAPGATSGLVSSISQTAQQLTEARQVRLKLKLDEVPGPLPPDVEYNLLRIAQEAISNSVKHSGARTIEVSLGASRQGLTLSVTDDGTGLRTENGSVVRAGHYGLIGMKERATQIGAQLNINSEAGRGTTVSVLLPANHSHSNGDSL